MAPLTKQGRQHADGNYPTPEPELEQPRRQKGRAVVLDVMYPSAAPQLSKGTGYELPRLPPGTAAERQTAAVLFYDPMSSTERHDPTRQRPSAANGTVSQKPRPQSPCKEKSRTRAEAIEAVAHELARLSLSTRRTRDASE